MRACLVPGQPFVANADIVLSEEAFHHLVQVCRCREQDQVLLLNGDGGRAQAQLKTITKRQAIAHIQSVEVAPPPVAHDALIVVPKRDALDLMLKMAVELGFRKVWLLRGTYSPERLPEADRIASLIQSGVEQSNNAWPTTVNTLKTWQDVPWSEYQHVLCFDPSGASGETISFENNDGILTLIGPEGGFAADELALIKQLPNAKILAWQTPILRAPTALAMAAGWVTARMDRRIL